MAEIAADAVQATATQTTPPAGDQQTASTQQAAQGSTVPVADKPASLEELQRLLDAERKDRADANKEAQSMRAKLRQLEQAEAERQKASMTEQERIKAELEEARAERDRLAAQAREIVGKSAVLAAAQKAGVIDPDAVYKLLRDDLQFGDDGTPKDIDKQIAELTKAKGYLLGQGTNPANPARGGAGAMTEGERLYRDARGVGFQPFDPANISRGS
jgi:hypothetical protein